MAAKKRKKKIPEEPLQEQVEPQKPDEGKYLSRLSSDELRSMQTRKTVFMLLSTLLFAVSLFLPVEGRRKVADIVALSTLYILFDVVLIVFSVAVSYMGFKRHKIRAEISEKQSPRGGFDKHTFMSYEIFNALHAVLLVVEAVIGFLTVEVWGMLNIAVVAASFVLSMLSRYVLYRANAHNLDYLPPRGDEDGEAAARESATEKESAAEQFYEENLSQSESEQEAQRGDEEGTLLVEEKTENTKTDGE